MGLPKQAFGGVFSAEALVETDAPHHPAGRRLRRSS
jgi:hypothetical protein